MNCPQCGRQVPQGAAVCPMCGFNLSQAYGAQTVFGGQMPPGGPGAMQAQPQMQQPGMQPPMQQQPSPYAPPGMQGMQQPGTMPQPGMQPPMQQQPSPYAPPGMQGMQQPGMMPQQGMGGVPNMQQPSSPSQPAYQPFQGGSSPQQPPYQPGPQMMGGQPMMAAPTVHGPAAKKGGGAGVIIAIVAVLVLAGGGAAAFFLTRGGDSKTAADQGSGTATASATDTGAIAASGSGSASASASGTAVAAGGSCQDIGTKLKSDTLAQMGPNASDTDKQMLEKMSTIVVRHCMEDAWSADVIQCGVTSPDPKKDCDPKLTDDQRSKLHAELDAATGTGSGSAVAAAGDGIAGLTAIRDAACACKDMDCANKALEMFDTWGTANGDKIGTSIDTAEASKLITEVQDCVQKAAGGDDLGNAIGGLGGGSGTGTAAAAGGGPCDAFLAITDAIVACDKFPDSSKDGLKQAADMIKQYRAGGAMDDTCQSSGETLEEAAKAVGCDVPAMPKAGGGGGDTDTPPVEATGDGKTGVKECDDFIAAYDALANCSKVPKSARDSFKQAEAQMKDSLAQMAKYGSSMNDSMKSACSQGFDSLKQSAKSLGCKL